MVANENWEAFATHQQVKSGLTAEPEKLGLGRERLADAVALPAEPA